ncbi:MAG: ATP-binding protein [Anaerolineales bacterium]|jgi:serine/threonine-protein kinase RsbW|nr:ATP-binding protein [Anaerolineales bacterium]
MAVATRTFPGRFESLEKISRFVKDAAKKAGLGEEAVYGVELAVDEACSNIIEHAYRGEDLGQIECSCEATNRGLKIVITDHGHPFNPAQVPKPDLSSSLEERRKGGLGLFFIDQMMDEARYEFAPGVNRLILIKHK